MIRSLFVALILAGTLLTLLPANVHPASAQQATSDWPPVGQIVQVRNPGNDIDLRITVTQVKDNPADEPGKRRGFRNLFAEVQIENLSVQQFTVSQWHFVLFDDLGLTTFSTSAISGSATYPGLEFSQLERGDKVRGWLTFEITVDARPANLVFTNPETPPYLTVIAWIDPEKPDAEGAQTIRTRSGATVGTLRIDAIITGFESTDPGIDPRRGWSTIAIAVTMTNLSDTAWQFRDEDFWVLDDVGDYYDRTFYDRSMDSFKQFPELGYRAKPGQIARGVLLFELPDDADLERIMYVPNADQFFVVGWNDPDLSLTGREAAASMDIDSRSTTGSKCQGVEAWMENALDVVETSAAILEDVSDPDADVDVTLVRKNAAQIRQMADDLRDQTVPPEAEAAHKALLEMMDIVADELDAAADRIDAGESVKAALKLLNAPTSPVTAAATTAVAEVVALSNDCDLSDM